MHDAESHASLGYGKGQGQAYGALEMGRGIGEALKYAAATLALFAYLGSDANTLTAVIVLFSSIVFGLGIASVFVLRRDSDIDLDESHSTRVNLDTVKRGSGHAEDLADKHSRAFGLQRLLGDTPAYLVFNRCLLYRRNVGSTFSSLGSGSNRLPHGRRSAGRQTGYCAGNYHPIRHSSIGGS